MAHITADAVLQAVTPSGTTSFTLGDAVTGFRRVQDVPGIANTDTLYYAARAVDARGTPTGQWENGLGTYNSATGVLTRTAVHSSSNGGAAVTFGAGAVWLANALLAAKTAFFDNTNALNVPLATAEPPTPASGLELYAREIAPGNTVLKMLRPSGVDSPVQDGIAFNRLVRWTGGSSTINVYGGGAVSSGTASAISPTLSSPNIVNFASRSRLSTSTTANNVVSIREAGVGTYATRRLTAGFGGFRLVMRFAIDTLNATARFEAGLADLATPSNIDPLVATSPGRVRLAFNSNAGTWNLVHNSSYYSPTVIDLGANFPINAGTDLMELVLFCAPGNGVVVSPISYRVRRYTTSANPTAEATGTISTNIPGEGTLLIPSMWIGNGATASAVAMQFASMTLESDF